MRQKALNRYKLTWKRFVKELEADPKPPHVLSVKQCIQIIP